MTLFQVILGKIVALHSKAMEQADETHFAALSRVNHFILVRDDFSGRLFPKLVEIRDTFDAAFGRDTCQRILGLGTGIPSEPFKVRRLSDRVVLRLDAPDFVLPPKRSEGVAVDTAQWVLEVRPDLEGLEGSMRDLSEARRESDRTLQAKLDAIEVYEDTYARCSRLLETIYLVVKRDHLAEKLRPAIPKPKSPDKEAGDSAEAGEQAAEDEGGEAESAPRSEDPASRSLSESSDDALNGRVGPKSSAAGEAFRGARVRPDRPPADAPPAED